MNYEDYISSQINVDIKYDEEIENQLDKINNENNANKIKDS